MAGCDEPSFQANEMLQSAVLQKLSVIGEVAARLSAETLAQTPQVPWKEIVGFLDVASCAGGGHEFVPGSNRTRGPGNPVQTVGAAPGWESASETARRANRRRREVHRVSARKRRSHRDCARSSSSLRHGSSSLACRTSACRTSRLPFLEGRACVAGSPGNNVFKTLFGAVDEHCAVGTLLSRQRRLLPEQCRLILVGDRWG